MRRAASLAARLGTILLSLLLWSLQACSGPPEAPNVVLVIGDDIGWPDFGFMGSKVAQTPHLDALAEQGVVFTHAFTTGSVCRPTQRSLLTGLHPIQFDARIAALRQAGGRFEPEQEILHFETLPRRLEQRGYTSFQGGKYWEESYQLAGFTHGMTTHQGEEVPDGTGFEKFAGGEALALGRKTMQPLWDFIDAHGDRPFFVWFAPMLPHIPHDPPPRYLRLYEGKGLPPRAQKYFANLSRFDHRVGELLAYLEEKGLRGKTLVVYLSDNGWDESIPARSRLHPALGGSKGKLSIYELGFRTPLVFSWPGVLPEGKRSDQLVSAVDVFNTILDFAGAEPVPGRPGSSLRSLLTGTGEFPRQRVIGGVDLLRDEEGTASPGEETSVRRAEAYFLRTRTWRYVWYKDDGREELYRIQEDPFETHSVVEQHPEQARRSRAEIEQWIAEMSRPLQEERAE